MGVKLRKAPGAEAYPVYFSPSDTSGEKEFEEFYTEDETTDMERFHALGVITGKETPDRGKLDAMIRELTALFVRETASKEEVVSVLSSYLPEFRHIETGKSLDGKM